MPWTALAVLLTEHEVGSKEGSCIVPAVFSGSRRHKTDASSIAVAFLDSDAGASLREITVGIAQHGWTAVISSTHSHLAAQTRVKRGNWDKFRAAAADQAEAPAAFLIAEKGCLPHIAARARVVQEEAEHVVFEHQPCPKFRIAIPLLHRWVAACYNDQRQANAAWKERIEALAAALNLNHDQACTDTSRLFYLPRRPAFGPAAEIAILDGTPCDLFGLPPAAIPKVTDGKVGQPGNSRYRHDAGGDNDPRARCFTDPETGEVVDLLAWASSTAHRFQVVDALERRRPEAFIGKVSGGSKHHIRCINEDRHTEAGADGATMIINASESTSQGFVYHCRHGHCDGVDRLIFLRQMLEQGWLSYGDLHNPDFLADPPSPNRRIRVVPGQLAEVVDQAEQALLEATLSSTLANFAGRSTV